jgi:hypothetical protein
MDTGNKDMVRVIWAWNRLGCTVQGRVIWYFVLYVSEQLFAAILCILLYWGYRSSWEQEEAVPLVQGDARDGSRELFHYMWNVSYSVCKFFAVGENTQRLMDGFLLGKVRWWHVDLCHICTTAQAVECKSDLHWDSAHQGFQLLHAADFTCSDANTGLIYNKQHFFSCEKLYSLHYIYTIIFYIPTSHTIK